MATKRITDVDFLERLDSNESFFVNQNNAIRQINKSNIVFDVVNGGTGATDAAAARINLGAADSAVVDEIATSLDDFKNDFNEYVETTNDSISEISNKITPIDKGGTGSNDGADGLRNLFAAGATVLSSYQYDPDGEYDEIGGLPPAGTKGRIFFKKVVV